MITATLTRENPNLLIFLPVFYTVWSDDVLTPHERTVLEKRIHVQSWLRQEEKQFLIQHINPASPPDAAELKAWLTNIRSAALDEPITGIVDVGMKVVQTVSPQQNGQLKTIAEELNGLDEDLGLIRSEIRYTFFPELRKTITQAQQTTATFDITTLENWLDGKQAELIRKVKTLLCDPAFRYYTGETKHEYREQVLAWCNILAQQGYGSMAYPKVYGGQDDMEGYFTVMETLSYHDLSLVVKFGVQFGLFGMSVFFLGTEKHHKKYLQKIGSLQLPGCFAMTETGHGSNVRGIETTAIYDHSSKTFTINTPNVQARKEYIGNAALHGQMATVFAKLIVDNQDYGVSAFLVPIRDTNGNTLPGITIEDCGKKMGLNGVDNGLIHFNQIVIPKENMLDRFAGVDDAGKFTSPINSDNRRFFTMLGTLVGGRIGIPRSAVSAAKSGLAIAIQYSDQRRQFGPEGAPEVPILNYRTHQRRLMPLLANAYALHVALQYLTKRFVHRTEDDMQEIEALAAGLKAFTTWNTTHTLQTCRECCGGKGYLSENRIDDLKNDTDIYTTFEGDNTVLMQLVAKSRLSEFKKEFSNMNLMGMVNYVASQTMTSITEMNPIIVRNTDDEHLLDFEFHLNAFSYRERDILTSAAKRLKRHLDSGMDSFDAFNVVQHHLVDVGIAHIERVILEQFQAAVNNTRDEGCKTVLTKLCQLFALDHLDKHKGWYLENDYMTGAKTKAIRKMLNQLCWNVRQDAVPLTKAFGIPDALLAAPIVTKRAD